MKATRGAGVARTAAAHSFGRAAGSARGRRRGLGAGGGVVEQAHYKLRAAFEALTQKNDSRYINS